MRFRNATRPNRQRIRSIGHDAVATPTEAEVLRDNLPGSESFPSGISVGDPTEPPAQVVGVIATAGLRTTLVEWDRLDGLLTVDGAGGYEVQLDTVATFDAAPRVQRTSATMASFTDLAPDTTYFVRVRGVQGADNYGEWSASASIATAQAGASDIQASAITADKIAANAVTAAKLAAITMEVGKFIQSDNYDGTDVATGDATQGFRIEAEGNAEFQDVRVRGDLRANTLISHSGDDNLIPNWSFETASIPEWSVDVGTLSVEPYADTPFGSNVLRYRNSTLASQYPTLTYDRVTGFVPTAAYYVAIAGARDQIEPETYYADLHVDWYDDADVLISTDTILEERITGHDFFTVLGGHDNPVFAPENVSYAKVRIEFTNYGDAVPVNHDVYFDGFYFAPYTYFKGAFLEGAASIELTRHYDDRSPTSKLQPGYWYIRVPKTFDGEFNSVPTIYGDVADYGTDQRESQVGIATARPELVGGGDGRRARLTLYSGFQDSSKGSSINLGADRIDTPISSLPNGRLQRAERTSDMSFTNSWVTVATTPAFAFPDGDYSRSICVTGQATLVCTAAPQLLLMRVQYIIGGGAWTTAQEGTTTNPTTSSEMMVHMDGEHTVNAGDLVQWRLQVKRGGSSGTGWVYAGPSDPAWVKAVDEGAA